MSEEGELAADNPLLDLAKDARQCCDMINLYRSNLKGGGIAL